MQNHDDLHKVEVSVFLAHYFPIPVFSKRNMMLSDTFMFRNGELMGVASSGGTR